MAEETPVAQTAVPKKKLNKKMLVIIIGSVLVFGTGAFLSIMWFSGKGKAAPEGGQAAVEEAAPEAEGGGEEGGEKGKNSAIVPLEPFVVNLSAPGRYLKITLHLELKSAKEQDGINLRMAMIRDVIITILSSKSADAVSGPEGKFQLKDEILFRVNQSLGREVVKNIYFTEFVMQ